MTRSSTILFAALTTTLLATAAITPSFAQNPAPAPTPSPSPNPSPLPILKPGKFESPLNERPVQGEEADFAKLVQLYDEMQAAGDAMDRAKRCGLAADLEAAKVKYDAAEKAYDDAVDQYVRDYANGGNSIFPPGPAEKWKRMKDVMHFNSMKDDVDDAVAEASEFTHLLTGQCPAKTENTTPPSPPKEQPEGPKPDTAPEHSSLVPRKGYWGDPWSIVASGFNIDYDHYYPKYGQEADEYGFKGNLLFGLTDNLKFNFGLGYHNVSNTGQNLDNVVLDAALLWRMRDVRFGPTVGYQSNSTNWYSSDTFNYGGFVDYYAHPRITLSGKLGGFSTDPGYDGYYLGGQVVGYPLHRLAVGGSIDYTRFNGTYSGYDETDYRFFLEKMFWEGYDDEDDDDCWPPPTSLYFGYTHSSFSPGNYHVDMISFGLNIYTDAIGKQNLIDHQNTGTPNWQTKFYPLQLRF